ncbi:zinc-finger of a C2HC-type [Phytophthora infestans]|uniref:Zinc-finger of a C2HC-type n=1 Tax=Phytophthora infestans TaxID=4787 RepID=A0A833TFJ1_PHYIN|nr:zinc-finger of a C2HC-type [Phytophthora infestans]
MEVPAKVKIRGTPGCELLRHVESVDPRAAEGLRRKKSDVPLDLDVLLEEETRRSITDPYQRLLFEVKVLHRKGNFKSSEGEEIVQRVRDIANGGKKVLDLSGFILFDDFVDLLVPYLRSKTCKLVALKLSGTPLGGQAAINIAQATNKTLQTLHFSDNPIPVEAIRLQATQSGHVILSGHNFSHLDAAAIGVLVERERKQIQKLDLSGNSLTGPKANIFHGITSIFECLKKCRHLQELHLSGANLRSDGLVAFANAIQDFPALEKLDLSRNRMVYNSTNEKRLSGVESLCNALWRVHTLRELSLVGNNLDYQSSVFIAEMLKVNCTIVSLTLAQNPLKDAGASDVSTALKKNATLLSLNLSDCQISCEGLQEVASMLRKFNSTLRTIDITDNPDVRSQGYRNLVKCISTNHTLTEVIVNPTSRYERYASKTQEFLAVNVLLNAVRTNPKRFTGFPALNETQRTNFVNKLERFSESELRQLREEQIVEKAAIFSDEKDAAGLSTLRHYAAKEHRRRGYLGLPTSLGVTTRKTVANGRHYAPDTSLRLILSSSPYLMDLKPGPVTRVCHVCGRQYGLSSFEIHLKQCKKLWVQQEEQKPKNERRPIPKTPPKLGQGGEDTSKGMSRQELEALNQAAQEAYNVHGMEKCDFCGRTFAEGRLAIHNKSCRADNVSKKSADGAAPRNKKEPEVDYGRARPAKQSADNSSSQSSGGGSARGSSPSKPTTAASTGGGRALAGSIASNRNSGSASRSQIHSPLEQNVDADSLKDELQGKESMISVIQAKLDRWEATTVATLQEIRDLKDVFAQLNAS